MTRNRVTTLLVLMALAVVIAVPNAAPAETASDVTITASDPPSGGNDNTPILTGTISPGTDIVDIHANATCTNPVAGGPATDFTGPGFQVTVEDNSINNYWAQGTDTAGIQGPCNGPFLYVEVTPTVPPSDPTAEITSSDPPSGSNHNEPTLFGTVPDGTTQVELFANGACANPLGVFPADQLTTFGIPVTVADNSTTGFHVRAIDATSAAGPCSPTAFVYVEDSPPSTPVITDSDPDSPADDEMPEIKGTSDGGTTVTLYTSSDCTGPVAASGSAAAFQSPGLTVTVADGSSTTFYANATGQDGETSGCSAGFTYDEIPEPSEEFVFTGFFRPLVNPPAWNVVNAGRVLAAKWHVATNDTPVVSPDHFESFTSRKVNCDTLAPESDPRSEAAAGDSGLQNRGDGNWQFNVNTSQIDALPAHGPCRVYTLTLSDGQSFDFWVRFR